MEIDDENLALGFVVEAIATELAWWPVVAEGENVFAVWEFVGQETVGMIVKRKLGCLLVGLEKFVWRNLGTVFGWEMSGRVRIVLLEVIEELGTVLWKMLGWERFVWEKFVWERFV